MTMSLMTCVGEPFRMCLRHGARVRPVESSSSLRAVSCLRSLSYQHGVDLRRIDVEKG